MKLNKKVIKAYTLIFQVGLSSITAIIIGLLIGIWLEKITKLPFTIVFIIIGMLAAVKSAYRIISSQIDLKGKSKNVFIHKNIQTCNDDDFDICSDDTDSRIDNI